VLVTVYVLGFACFALTADVASTAPGRHFAAQLLIVVGALVGLVASLLAIAANLSETQLWGTTRLLGTRSIVPAFSAHVIFSEPNFLGGFLLIPLTLYLWRSPESVPRLFALVTGIVDSCTRAAWVGMGGIVVACARIRPLSRRATLTVVCVIVLAFALLIATSGASAFLQRTVMPFTVTRDNTMEYRVRISAVMLRSWLTRPLVGHGAGAGHLVTLPLPSGRRIQGVWAGNAEVHLLQNSGLLGLAAFVLVVGVVGREVRRAARRRGATWATLGTPLSVADIFLLFSFQFTHALWLMYPYVYLGLLTAELSADEP
jgi:O-antigen ligase